MSQPRKVNWAFVAISLIVGLGIVSFSSAYLQLRGVWVLLLGSLGGRATYFVLSLLSETDEAPRSGSGSHVRTQCVPALHLLKNDLKLGPYTREHVANMLKIGQLSWDDVCWSEGMTDWAPLSTVMARPSSVPPPQPSFAAGTRPLPRTSTATPPSRPAAPFDGTLLLVSYAFCLVAASVIELSGGGPTLVGLIVLAGLAVFAALHYQCWKQVPGEFRSLEPKKAAGLMLIPLFNLYWAFVAMPALADSIERWELAEGDRTGSGGVIRAVAKVYATVILVTTVLTIVDPYPGVLVFAYVADLICAVLFFRSALKAERRLLGA